MKKTNGKMGWSGYGTFFQRAMNMAAHTKAAISFSVNSPIHPDNVNISNVSDIINVCEKFMHIFSDGRRIERRIYSTVSK